MLVDDALALLRAEPTLDQLESTRLQQLLTQCPRFILADDVTRTVMHLGLGDTPSHLLDTLDFARLPYRAFWVEYANAPRAEVVSHYNILTDPHNQPSRVGWLLESTADSLAGRATVFWRHQHGKVPETAAAQLFWDFRADVESLHSWGARAATARRAIENFSQTQHSSGHRWRNNPREFSAYTDLLLKFWFEPAALWQPMYSEAQNILRFDVVETMLQMGGKDVGSESLPILSTLLLLNARNAVERKPTDLRQINKARQKAKKPPLLDYITLSVRISAGRQRAYTQAGHPTGEKRPLHLCRGHFKRRKRASGEYELIWWNAHLRGDASIGTIKRTVHIKP